uniref:Uncharacterized protein n=1 Tax=Anopheles dirus TaxID=7168 RepID=A0A182N8F7_9DIPT
MMQMSHPHQNLHPGQQQQHQSAPSHLHGPMIPMNPQQQQPQQQQHPMLAHQQQQQQQQSHMSMAQQQHPSMMNLPMAGQPHYMNQQHFPLSFNIF